MTVDRVVIQAQRQMLLRTLTLATLLAASVLCAVVMPVVFPGGYSTLGLMLVATVWVAMSVGAGRRTQLMASSPMLIATGQLEQAEQNLRATIAAFSVQKPLRIAALHYLATLRHLQRRWADVAVLCRAVLSQPASRRDALMSSAANLMLAEASLQLGDLPTAHAALFRAAAMSPGVEHSVTRLRLQTEYEYRVGATGSLLSALGQRLRLIDVMPTDAAARCTGILALAAQSAGDAGLAAYLKRRSRALAGAGGVDLPGWGAIPETV